jgi:putative flavoprotein involved in K+ transport
MNHSVATGLIEEGAAFTKLDAAGLAVRDRAPISRIRPAPARFQVIVIGGGQAGLSVGYHLARRGLSFVILDANRRIGDAWRNRWDSLHLFTPARFDGLDGMKFPAAAESFPSKDAMADFLEQYAGKFGLPVLTGTRVVELRRGGQGYVAKAEDGRVFAAPHVVVAMGGYQKPRLPAFTAELAPEILQIHSSDYRNPRQLRDGGVLVVGAGNSGAEIAREVVLAKRQVWLAGPKTGSIPVRPGSLAARLVLPIVFRLVYSHILTIDTRIGRKARPKLLTEATPLIRVREEDLVALGVERVARVVGVRRGLPSLEDGNVVDAGNIIWCTGYTTDFSWIDSLPLDEHGQPSHRRGVVDGEPGLYFVGLPFLYALASEMVRGVGRDARYVVDRISERVGQPGPLAP